MLKKCTHLILSASIFLASNYQIKAMQPNKKTKAGNGEQNNILQSSGINSLKYLSALTYLQKLKNTLAEPNILNILNAINNSEKNEGLIIPEELKDYCIAFAKIDEQCALLKQFSKDESLQNWFAPENEINRYKQILYKICGEQYPNSNLILSIFDKYIRSALEYYEENPDKVSDEDLRLKYINILLNVFLKRIDANENIPFEELISKEEKLAFSNIFCLIFTGFREIECNEWNTKFKPIFIDLCKLLFKYDLLPALDYTCITNSFDFLDMLLSDTFIDIELISNIINTKKDIDYDWNELITHSKHEDHADYGDTTIHHISSQDKLEILLKLIAEKKLDLHYFINIKNDDGYTPLMRAIESGKYDIAKLFIMHTTSLHSSKLQDALKYIRYYNYKQDSIPLTQDEKKSYYEKAMIIAQIESHCVLLDQFKKNKYSCLKINENLAEYKQLLYEISTNQLNLNKILRILDTYLSIIITNLEAFTDENDFPGITLKDINVILQTLIKLKTCTALKDQELQVLSKIVFSIFIVDYTEIDTAYNDLRILLANYNLVPRLDLIIPNYNLRNFFMYIARDNNFDIELFNLIVINKLKNINNINTIKTLFGMRDQKGNTVLQYATKGGSKNKVMAILNWMNHYNLNLNYFINAQNNNGKTALMIANRKGYTKIVEVLAKYIGVPDLAPDNSKQ